jgi:hypothetical protein
MRASRHYITPDSSPRTRFNGFEKGDKSKNDFLLRGNQNLSVFRHAPASQRLAGLRELIRRRRRPTFYSNFDWLCCTNHVLPSPPINGRGTDLFFSARMHAWPRPEGHFDY